jgi:hypothetical protein
MMRTTVIYLALAGGSLAAAAAMRPAPPVTTAFEDTGTVLFDGFTDPTVATSLEVQEWNDTEAKIVGFKVEQKEGRWLIPSHHEYPADATERMGKAAASFVGVKKDIYYGDDVNEHGAFGLLDPTDAAGDAQEKGRRFTLADGAGTVLVDVLVGKEIPDKQGFFYVRLPEDKRVYGSKLELDISTSFIDWIEKDLLHIEKDDIVAVVYDPYKIDENTARVMNQAPVKLTLAAKADDPAKKEWALDAGVEPPDGKKLDVSKITQMVGAVDRLQIVGVRKRPERLTLPLLQAHGFFVNTQTGRLFGNEGEIHAIGNDGVVFTLFFGEITLDSGLALTSGAAKDPMEDVDKNAEEEETKTAGNRYLFVDVTFDPTRVAEGADAGAGQKRSQELRARFDAWFFVISDTSFKQIHKTRDELFKDV